MNTDLHLRITGILLTVLVVGVILLMVNAEKEPNREMQVKELALTMRPLAIQLAGTEQILEAMPEGEDTAQIESMLEDQLTSALKALVLSRASLHTDSSYIIGAGMAAAYQADRLAWDILEEVRDPNADTESLSTLLQCSGNWQKTVRKMSGILPQFPGLEEVQCQGHQLQQLPKKDSRLSLLPSLAQSRLRERALRADGKTTAADTLRSDIKERETRAITSLGRVYMIPLVGGFFGMFMLFFQRRVRKFLHHFPGLGDTSLFPTDSLRLYLVLISWFAFSLAFAILSQEGGPLGFIGKDPGFGLVASTLASGLFSLVLIAKVAPQKRGSLWKALGLHANGFKRKEWQLLMLAIGGYCIAVPVTIGLSTLTQMFTGETPVLTHPIIWMLADASSPGLIFLLILGASVIAPFFEEILFRGFMFQILRDKIGGTLSILVSSLIFAALHPSAYTILPLFGLSCILCLLYARTGSLWPSILLHAIHNSVSMLLVLDTMANP